MNDFIRDNFLQHHGMKGMHWGERRYQNEDGSLTPLGRIHYGRGKYVGGSSSGDYKIWGHKVGEGYGLASRLNAYGLGGSAVINATKAAVPRMQAERRKHANDIINFKKTPYDPRRGYSEQQLRDKDIDRADKALVGLRDAQRGLAAARLEMKTKDLPYTRDLEYLTRKGSGYHEGVASSSSAVQSAMLGFQHLQNNKGRASNNPYVSYGNSKSTSREYLSLVNAGKLFLEGVDEPLSRYDRYTGVSTGRQTGSGYQEWKSRTYPMHQDYMGRSVLNGPTYSKRMSNGDWHTVSTNRKDKQYFTTWNGSQH